MLGRELARRKRGSNNENNIKNKSDNKNRNKNGVYYCPACGVLKSQSINDAIRCLTPLDPQESYAQLNIRSLQSASYCSVNRYSLQEYDTPTLSCEEFDDEYECDIGQKTNDDLLPPADDVSKYSQVCFADTYNPTFSPSVYDNGGGGNGGGGNDGGGGGNGGGKYKWYPDFTLGEKGQCVESCKSNQGPFCGGVNDFWEEDETYGSADECCKQRFSFINKRQCVPNYFR